MFSILDNIEKLKILLCLTFVFKASNYFSNQTDYSNKRTAYKTVDSLTDMKYEEKKERKRERKKKSILQKKSSFLGRENFDKNRVTSKTFVHTQILFSIHMQ